MSAAAAATEIVGWSAGIVGVAMAFAPLLQLNKIIRHGDAGPVSASALAIVTLGTGLWAAYGLMATDWLLAVPNAVGCLTNGSTALLAARLGRPTRRQARLTSSAE